MAVGQQGCRAAGLLARPQPCGQPSRGDAPSAQTLKEKLFFLYAFQMLKDPEEGTALYFLQLQKSQHGFILAFMSKHEGFIFFFCYFVFRMIRFPIFSLFRAEFGPAGSMPASKPALRPRFGVKGFEGRKDTQSPGFIPDPSKMVPVGGRNLRFLHCKQIGVAPEPEGVPRQKRRPCGPHRPHRPHRPQLSVAAPMSKSIPRELTSAQLHH